MPKITATDWTPRTDFYFFNPASSRKCFIVAFDKLTRKWKCAKCLASDGHFRSDCAHVERAQERYTLFPR